VEASGRLAGVGPLQCGVLWLSPLQEMLGTEAMTLNELAGCAAAAPALPIS
jgi:hypothetical protein